MSLLHIENLTVELPTQNGFVKVLDKVSLRMDQPEVLGIVGESGSGKSMLALAIMGLLSSQAKLKADFLSVHHQDIMKLSVDDRRRFISQTASIIFQKPENSLNPCFTVGEQLCETLKLHGLRKRSAQTSQALELLSAVGIQQPELRFKQYPHQMSGGMNQRIMIAIAIAASPKLLIADEPTTALDVTIQAQIIDLLLKLHKEKDMGLILITHDFALLSESTNAVSVIYSGQIMEHAATEKILHQPRHPYTRALLESIPHIGERHRSGDRLHALKGTIPPIDHLPVGCRLGPRCPRAARECVKTPRMTQIDSYGYVRCHFPHSDIIVSEDRQ